MKFACCIRWGWGRYGGWSRRWAQFRQIWIKISVRRSLSGWGSCWMFVMQVNGEAVCKVANEGVDTTVPSLSIGTKDTASFWNALLKFSQSQIGTILQSNFNSILNQKLCVAYFCKIYFKLLFIMKNNRINLKTLVE